MSRLFALCVLVATVACSSPSSGVKGPLLAAFGPGGATAQAAGGRRFALVVGIREFDDGRFGPLRYPQDDAVAVAEALRGFDGIQLLIEKEDTGRSSILAALAELERKANKPGDTIVLYFSTHGSLARAPGSGQLERYLVARDTRMDVLAETGLRVADLTRALEAMTSRRKLLILATCHSGLGKSQLDDSLSDVLASMKGHEPPPLPEVSEATIILTACAFGETARESEELKHDIYTYFLLEALRAGDRDRDAAVTASEAHDYARAQTYAYTKGQQRPTAQSEVLGHDAIVLAGAPVRAGLPLLYSYAASSEGLEVVVDGAVKGALPGGIAVEPGRHEVELRSAHTKKAVWSGDIELKPGQRAEVHELIPEPWRVHALVETTAFVPVSPLTFGQYLPPAVGFSGALLLDAWPSQAMRYGLDLGYVGGVGTQPGFGDDVLPFLFHMVQGSARVAWKLEITDWLVVAPQARLGMFGAARTFVLTDRTGTELVYGPQGSALVTAEWRPLDWLWVSASTEVGALVAPIGGHLGPHPWVGLRLGIGPAL